MEIATRTAFQAGKSGISAVRSRKGIVLAAGGVSLTCVILFSIVPHRATQSHAGEAEHVYRVSKGPVQLSLSLIGAVEAGEAVSANAPFDGYLGSVSGRLGEITHQGDVLATMDTSEIDGRIREAETALLRAEMNADLLSKWENGTEVLKARRSVAASETALDSLERQEKDTKQLLGRGIVSRNEYDGVAQQLNSQRMQVTSAKEDLAAVLSRGDTTNRRLADIELQQARVRMDDLNLQRGRLEVKAGGEGVLMRPPANGSLNASTAASVQTGSHVAKGQPLFTIAMLADFNVVAHVNEVDVNKIKVGQEVTVESDSFPGIQLTGAVVSVSAEAEQTGSGPQEARFEIRARFRAKDEASKANIRVGMSARMTVTTYKNQMALIVPHSAVIITDNGAAVDVVSTDGQRKEVSIVTGVTTENGVEVLSGLTDETQIYLP